VLRAHGEDVLRHGGAWLGRGRAARLQRLRSCGARVGCGLRGRQALGVHSACPDRRVSGVGVLGADGRVGRGVRPAAAQRRDGLRFRSRRVSHRSSDPAPRPVTRRGVVLAAVAAATLAAWIVSIAEMHGMDQGPGTDLGAFGWFLGVWVSMTGAMMLPSAAPVLGLVAWLRDGAVAAFVFGLGYLIAWTLYGLAAYGAFRGLRALWPSSLSWPAHGPLVAGGALVAAGLYQLTPLKSSCLRHCRAPL